MLYSYYVLLIREKHFHRLTKLNTTLALALPFATLVTANALARPKPLEGPIPAFVERVVDGDTLVVRARIWLGQELRIMVRVAGIDAPEMRARCDKERQLARSARYFVKRLIGQRKITLSDIRQGKYAGRVIATVTDKSGSSLSAQLLDANLARPYTRGRRKSWCPQSFTSPYKKTKISR
ncbi:MAG: thermonuclease family protein [Hyphomicrobiaceae bacterium]|nr:thermonuclease family protein [Hyphomicrobiaceae bacterium]